MSSRKRCLLPFRENLLFYEAPVATLVLLAAAELVFPGYSSWLAGGPLVLAAFVVGMPHGAVDWQVIRRFSRRGGHAGWLRYFGPYLLAVALLSLLFYLAPLWILALFGLTTVMHFGLADVRDVEKRSGASGGMWERLLAAGARGSIVLALPFLFSPGASVLVVNSVLSVVGGQPVTVGSAGVAVGAGTVLTCAGLALALVWTARLARGAGGATRIDFVELCALGLAFYLLHPLFAMGLYVLVWHSWRHLHTLSGFFDRGRDWGKPAEIIRTLARLHLDSLPLLLPTLVALGGLAWWRLDRWTAESLAAVVIAVFVVVTLPHHLLVERVVAGMKTGEDAARRPRSPGLPSPRHRASLDGAAARADTLQRQGPMRGLGLANRGKQPAQREPVTGSLWEQTR